MPTSVYCQDQVDYPVYCVVMLAHCQLTSREHFTIAQLHVHSHLLQGESSNMILYFLCEFSLPPLLLTINERERERERDREKERVISMI